MSFEYNQFIGIWVVATKEKYFAMPQVNGCDILYICIVDGGRICGRLCLGSGDHSIRQVKFLRPPHVHYSGTSSSKSRSNLTFPDSIL